MENKSNRKRCEKQGCKTLPYFNFPGAKTTRFCAKHRIDGMCRIWYNSCRNSKCQTEASFNFKGEKPGLFCFKHKKDGMVNVKCKICEVHECTTRAAFNTFGELKPRFCSAHKTREMANILKINRTKNQSGTTESLLSLRKNKKSRCVKAGCQKTALFNKKEEKVGRFCFTHKVDGMENKSNRKRCEKQGCKTLPYFNFPGAKTTRFCAKHRIDGMCRIWYNSCRNSKCQTEASFNFKGEKPGLFCFKHKKDGMVNVKCKICEVHECTTRAAFNTFGELKPRFCSVHKTREMANILTINRTKNQSGKKYSSACCIRKECNKKPSYNFSGGQMLAKDCKDHSTKGMGDVAFLQKKSSQATSKKNSSSHSNRLKKSQNWRITIQTSKLSKETFNPKKGDKNTDKKAIPPTCAFHGCKKRPLVHFDDSSRESFCAQHQLSHTLCEAIGCMKKATFSLKGEPESIFCSEHRMSGVV